MDRYDWIVIGAGITGAALSYELAKQGLSVLLLEQDHPLQGATRYSYGGLAYWTGKPLLLRSLSLEGLERYRTLSAELDHDIEFQERDLLLTITPEQDPQAAAAAYSDCLIPPQLIDPQAAHELEPLLNPQGICGALRVTHGHIRPELTAQAFQQAAVRQGASHQIAQVKSLRSQPGGVELETQGARYSAGQVGICAGGLGRSLLRQSGIAVQLYFTHAELIEIPTSAHDLRLQPLVSPAILGRSVLEKAASRPETDPLWDQTGHEQAPPILDPGVFQFADGQIRLGQISQVRTDPHSHQPPTESERQLRDGIRPILPAIADLPGIWHHCLVAFSADQLPLVGEIPGHPGIHLFSGFSNPLVIVPVLAQRFAAHVMGTPNPLIPQLSPERFSWQQV